MCDLCRPRDAYKPKGFPDFVHPEKKGALLLRVLGAMCFERGVVYVCCLLPGRYFLKVRVGLPGVISRRVCIYITYFSSALSHFTRIFKMLSNKVYKI